MAAIPPFCVTTLAPPANCEAPAALPCTGDCPRNLHNAPDAWRAYWERCAGVRDEKPGLEQKRFTCGSPRATELHIVYFAPAAQYVCCAKDPFSGNTSG